MQIGQAMMGPFAYYHVVGNDALDVPAAAERPLGYGQHHTLATPAIHDAPARLGAQLPKLAGLFHKERLSAGRGACKYTESFHLRAFRGGLARTLQIKWFMLDTLDDFDGSPAARRRVLEAFQSTPEGPPQERSQVDHLEATVEADPAGAFRVDEMGMAWLGELAAGRFRTCRLGEMRPQGGSGRLRLWVMTGAHPVTDIGALQAFAPPGSLFQVASQFNCLEAPGAYLVRVADYFFDPTQGPRASISAYPGTLLRHYRAPDGAGGHFVQSQKGRQLNLLHAVEAPVNSGYLTSADLTRPAEFAARLEQEFDLLEVGVHEGVQVVLGAQWDGPVRAGTRISQVFTSTLAAGGYGRMEAVHLHICRQLLRAAYLGTLLAAAALRQRRAVLTLIGGGVFGNPIPLIWESILWAVEQVEPHLTGDLTVVVNGRNLIPEVDEETVRREVLRRGGEILFCYGSGIRL